MFVNCTYLLDKSIGSCSCRFRDKGHHFRMGWDCRDSRRFRSACPCSLADKRTYKKTVISTDESMDRIMGFALSYNAKISKMKESISAVNHVSSITSDYLLCIKTKSAVDTDFEKISIKSSLYLLTLM